MEEERWVRRVCSYFDMKSVAKVRKRTRKLRSKCLENNGYADQEMAVKKRAKAAEREMWEGWMRTKSALVSYRKYKMEIAKESICDNSRRSSLLFKARIGMLRTRAYRAKYEGIATVCGECGEKKESDEHLLLYCKRLHPAVAQSDSDLVQAFGFKGTDGKDDVGKAEILKHRLSDCWHTSREE